MVYYIHLIFKEYFSPINVFQYITVRSAGAILTSLLISFLISPFIIKKLKSYDIYQKIRDDGPSTHLSKSGTPTMGGIIILISMLLSTLMWARLDNRFIVIMLISTVYLGFVGFIDDYLKLVKHNKKGLTPKKKIFTQFIFASILSTYLYLYPTTKEFAYSINIPFFKDAFLYLGIFYLIFMIFIIVGSSNAVNLTDGLDGLAIGCVIFASITYMIFAYVAGHINFSDYLKIIYIKGSGELVVYLSAIVGAGLGFLWINAYPAEVFMGDTGSLFLGGVIGIIAILIKQEILLMIVGGIFVLEALSVILQVGFFKIKGRRIFKMAPLHHHFELKGWAESKVVIRFWIISIVLSLIALSALKLR